MCVRACVQLKEKVAEKFNLAMERICLIHTGKILDDAEDLIGRGIIDDTVVHMVVKSAVTEVCCSMYSMQSVLPASDDVRLWPT